MNFKKRNKNKTGFLSCRKGTSIIEALVLIFVFSVAVLAFYSVFAIGTKYILSSKNKILAVSIANGEMEKLRNLPYADVALAGGIPSGSIDPDKTVSVEGKSFHVVTDIKFYDDPDDGVFGGSPSDTVPNDYKIAEIFVYWGQETDGERAYLSSRFVPRGIESSVGGGTLSINSIDLGGNPVANVTVNIFNDTVSPNVNYTTHTDSGGNLLLQGVPADNDLDYKITMSKSDYETVETYPSGWAAFIPKDIHTNIIAGALNEKTLVINQLSDLTFNSVDAFGDSLADVGFKLTGGRQLDDGSVATATYSYDSLTSTDSSGEFSLEDTSPGTFTLDLSSFTFNSGSYQFMKLEDGDDFENNVLNLSPGDDFFTNMIFMDTSLDSAYIEILDSATASPIEGAEVRLENSTLGYDVALLTDKYGYVYFPENATDILQNGETYQISVSKSGYDSKTDNIAISQLTNKSISLDVE